MNGACTEGSSWIKHRKLKYSIRCLRDVILKNERDLSNNISNTSISGVKFSCTTLYIPCQRRDAFSFPRRPIPSVSSALLYRSIVNIINKNIANRAIRSGDLGCYLKLISATNCALVTDLILIKVRDSTNLGPLIRDLSQSQRLQPLQRKLRRPPPVELGQHLKVS